MAPTRADDGTDVTVVIVVHNDAERLPRAVRSAAAQTLESLEVLVVDDASSDDTQEVAEALAAAQPDRVRYHRLTTNSGAAGRPRNVGIDHARGRYVIFLDSDDELDRDACRVLLAAATETGADITAGRCVRVEVAAGDRIDPWFDWLYRTRQDLAGIDDKPDLLFDTNSTNKLYALEFLHRTGLRFPEGRFYEDLEFITKAYVLARGITVIPDRVYLWYIYRDLVGHGSRLSVTQSRRELKNFTDRLAVHRELDAFMAEHASPDVQLHKDVKFLKIDMKLCVQDTPELDEALARTLVDELGDYLDGIRPQALQQVDPMLRVAAYLARCRDLPGVVSAAYYIAHGKKVSARLHLDEGRVFWGGKHLDTPAGRAALDVTELGLLRRLELFNRVSDVRVDGTRLTLEGVLLNQLERIPTDSDLSMQLEVRTGRGSARTVTASASVLGRPDGDVHWRAAADLRPLARSLGLVHRTWSLRSHLHVRGKREVSRLTVTDRAFHGLTLPLRPRAGALAADHLQVEVNADGDLVLAFVPPGPAARVVDRLRTTATRSGAARRLRTMARRSRKAVAIARRRIS